MEKFLRQENIKLKRATGHLQNFFEIFECLISGDNELLFNKVLDICKRETGSFHGFIGLLKSDSEMYIPTFKNIMDSCKVESGKLYKNVSIGGDDKHFKYLYETSLKTMKPYFTNNVNSDRFLSDLPKGHIKITNFLSVPILLREKSVGLIALSNSTDDYTDESVRKVEKFVKLVAISLKVYENDYFLDEVNSFLNIFDDVFYFLIEDEEIKFISNLAVDFILEKFSFFVFEGQKIEELPQNELFDFIRYAYSETVNAKIIDETVTFDAPDKITFGLKTHPVINGDKIIGALIALKDLTDFENMLIANMRDLDSQKLISDILQDILKSENLREATYEAIIQASEYADFDRASIFERFDDGKIGDILKWSRDGTLSEYRTLENNLFWQRVYDIMGVNNIILDNVKNSESDMSEFFGISDSKSVLIFPLYVKGRLNGFIIFEDLDIKNRSVRELDFLRIFSNIISGVTAQKKAEDELIYESTHDKLTGVYNRAYYEAEIERIHKSRNFPVAFFIIDLNGLKQVNDNLGHLAGDELIKSAAKILKNSTRGCDCLARIGGDEFAIIVQSASVKLVENIRERILRNQEEFNKTVEIKVSAAIGVAIAESENDVENAIKTADSLMYENKRKIKNALKNVT